MRKPVGVIMAAGKGSRMTEGLKRRGPDGYGDRLAIENTVGSYRDREDNILPKHLLPLGNGETPLGRLEKEMIKVCSRIITLVPEDKTTLFEERKTNKNNKIVSTSGGFTQNLQTLAQQNIEDVILLTTGDLIFLEEEIISFYEKNKSHSTKGKNVIGFETNKDMKKGRFDFPMRMFLLQPQITRKIQKINPESKLKMAFAILSHIRTVQRSSAQALVNLNTIKDYQRAIDILSR